MVAFALRTVATALSLSAPNGRPLIKGRCNRRSDLKCAEVIRKAPEWARMSRNAPECAKGEIYKGFQRAPRPRPVGSARPLAFRVARSSRTRRLFACWSSRERTSLRARARPERRNSVRIASCCSVKSPAGSLPVKWPACRKRTLRYRRVPRFRDGASWRRWSDPPS